MVRSTTSESSSSLNPAFSRSRKSRKQNFLLAIIVEAYMQVRKRNEDFKSENEFLTDCFNSLSAYIKRFRYGWPRRDVLARALAFDGKLSVGFRELEATKMFSSHYGIKKFLQHYTQISRVCLPYIFPASICSRVEPLTPTCCFT